jgi:hypothetical protein
MAAIQTGFTFVVKNKFSCTHELFDNFPKQVLLVGNGFIENKRELIDSYECVIRFNDFRIDGYERHVGTKISAIGFSSNNLETNETKHLIETYNRYVNHIPLFCLSIGSPEYDGQMLSLQLDTRLISPETHIRKNPTVTLTTGVSTALNLALFFDKDVHLLGFDFMKTGHYWNEQHMHSRSHSSNFEFNVITNIKNIHVL